MKGKNHLKIGIAVLLSGVLLFGVALTGNASGSAYEQLKLLLREEPVQMDNMTLHMDLAVTENGSILQKAVGDMKADKTAEKMSGQFVVSGKDGEKAFTVYKNGELCSFKPAGSENWYGLTCKEGDRAEKMSDRKFDREGMKKNPQLREAFMDTILGDLKDQMVLEESDGLRTFSLALDKGNMPVLVQAAFAAGGPERDSASGMDADLSKLPAELQALCSDMMEYRNTVDLSGEKTLEKVRFALTVDQKNQPRGFEVSARVSGTAKDGSSHTYDILCKAAISDINSTTPDEAAIDPASVILIDKAQ